MLFRKVIKFKYNNNNYQMFLSPKNQRFFLRINDNGKYEYLTIEEFITISKMFSNPASMKNAENGKKRFNLKPAVIIKNKIVPLIPIITSLVLNGCANNFTKNYTPNYNDYYDIETKNHEYNNNTSVDDFYSYEYNKQTSLDFDVDDNYETIEVEYFFENEFSHSVYVYDINYLSKIFQPKNVTKQDLIDVVNLNSNINNKYKGFILEYIELLFNRYPNNNYRILYENLKQLKVYECEDKFELFEYSWSMDSYACYIAKDNTIYTLKDYNYKKGTWEYQVIMHEISHALRTYRNESQEKYAEFIDLTAGDIIIEEALNSLFTVSLFDYEEDDIAYQLQSNMLKLIIESMDNYDLNDYVNHSSSYFAKKLDEFTGHKNYASVMFKVIDAQYTDYHNEYIEIEQSEFYPLYEWISDIYYKNKLTSDLSYDEMRFITAGLIERLTFDVPEEYNIDTNYFYTYLDRYIEEHNLGNKLSR